MGIGSLAVLLCPFPPGRGQIGRLTGGKSLLRQVNVNVRLMVTSVAINTYPRAPMDGGCCYQAEHVVLNLDIFNYLAIRKKLVSFSTVNQSS